MRDQPRRAIAEAIADHGPISFAEYMELALYGPGGFYERPPVGPEGDFVTSPHVHPVFGAFVGKAIRSMSTALGGPAPLRVAEVGAGDGTLATQVLRETADLPIEYTAIERSEGARRALAAIDPIRVGSQLDDTFRVVVANELLDNLPFRLIRGDHELRVGANGETLLWVETPWTDRAPISTEAVVPDGILAFVDSIAASLHSGYALLIDYGSVGSAGGEAHGYRAHRVIADLLTDPGTIDLTAGVDFDVVVGRARSHGLQTYPIQTQRDVLLRLGFERWMRRELTRQSQLLDRRAGIEAVRTWQGRHRASLLVDPAGLGRLLWLVLASPGLPMPDFLG
jgi:NADH dehydrogenase [ubiquinone] 1 alpha subcomplex assembly factor 7